MTFDLLIRNGTLVDGTGAAKFSGDVGITAGRITDIGTIPATATAKQVIDAQDKIVCPGFIDPHTHYDPQITWDSVLSSSSEHGITTIVMGNCGVGVAPCRPADRDLMIQDLVNVESMSQEVLRAGIKWDWETFPQYMDSAAKNASAVNRAFMVPLAPHCTASNLGIAASIHAIAATPLFLIHEFYPTNMGFNPRGIAMMEWSVDQDGYVALPQGVGLGVEMDTKILDEEAKKPQTYKWPGQKLKDGSIADY